MAEDLIIRTIAEVHRLTAAEAHWLRRVAFGALTGNRDRPVFLLAASVIRSDAEDLLALVLPGNGALNRRQVALLDFLLSAALEDDAHMARFVGALTTARMAPDPVKALTSDLVAVMHAWRRRALPWARHHNVFMAVRRFLARHRPSDPLPRHGDGPRFWEAEATRDVLTRYSTALRALADYAQAAQIAETWGDAGSLDEEAGIVVLADDAGLAGWDDPLEASKLESALSTVGSAPVKLLLAHERESLEVLTALADIVRVWPDDVLAALSLGQVQNAVTQAIRRGETVPSSAPFIAAAKTFDALRSDHAGLQDTVMAALHLIGQSRAPICETGSGRSTPSPTHRKRIMAMERRQGYSGLTPSERTEALGEMIEPMLALKALMEAYLKAWEKLGALRGAQLHEEHRVVFRRKLDALYGNIVEGAGA